MRAKTDTLLSAPLPGIPAHHGARSEPDPLAAGRPTELLLSERQTARRSVGNRFDVEQVGQSAVEDAGNWFAHEHALGNPTEVRNARERAMG